VPHENVAIPTPSVGDIVSFSFESRARTEIPLNPKIYRVRMDLSWNDLFGLHQNGNEGACAGKKEKR